ncbi:hypothetical protein SLS54_007629 [Diplodia seriata]
MSDASRPAKRARRTPAPPPPPTTKPAHASRTSSAKVRTYAGTFSISSPSMHWLVAAAERDRQRRSHSPSHQGVANGLQNGATTTTSTTNGAADTEDEDGTPLAYVPNRAIPPIAPTPPSACPLLPLGRRAAIVSRRYDPVTMQPLYRVRVDPVDALPARDDDDDDNDDDDDRGRVQSAAAEGADGQAEGDGLNGVDDADGCWAEDRTVPLADILAWVSPAELERFELEWEDDVVVMIDEEGAVLLVSKEVQRAMMGWGQQPPSAAAAAAAAASGPDAAVVVPAAGDAPADEAGAGAAVPSGKLKRGRKKKPTKEFVDMLPARRRGRPPKTAKLMGVVVEDSENAQESEEVVETASETAEYGEWVNPAHVRGTAPDSVVPDRRDEREESDSGDEDPLGNWTAAEGLLETKRSATPSRGSSRADTAQRGKARHNGSVPAGEPSMPASPVRRSMSSNGSSWEPEVDEEEEYEIESIIRDQLLGNTWYNLVKWANHPQDEHSWFTEEELDGAREVLDAYLERVRRKKKKGSKKGKERAVESQLEWDRDEDVEMALR